MRKRFNRKGKQHNPKAKIKLVIELVSASPPTQMSTHYKGTNSAELSTEVSCHQHRTDRQTIHALHYDV